MDGRLNCYRCHGQLSTQSDWIRADDIYFVGEIYTLEDLSVSFCAEKGFPSIDSEVGHPFQTCHVTTSCNRVQLKEK